MTAGGCDHSGAVAWPCGEGVTRWRCPVRLRVANAADPGAEQGASMTPWTATEVARLRRA